MASQFNSMESVHDDMDDDDLYLKLDRGSKLTVDFLFLQLQDPKSFATRYTTSTEEIQVEIKKEKGAAEVIDVEAPEIGILIKMTPIVD